MKDARKLRIVFGRDGFQMELVDDRYEGRMESKLTFGQRAIGFLSVLVTGGMIMNLIWVYWLR
jgi:hypothetical protein